VNMVDQPSNMPGHLRLLCLLRYSASSAGVALSCP
jgi:hypothetical protein